MVLDMPMSQRTTAFPATSLPAPAAGKKPSLRAAAKPPQAAGAARFSAAAGDFYPAGCRRQGKTAATDPVALVEGAAPALERDAGRSRRVDPGNSARVAR
jgi:hypothetical protein